ncbi:MAG: hypothetical protein JW866_10500 [Ignavibacteriales bacterium]|nr:hypothetical protein [Ignavibacteriales bacterium]
MEDKSIIDQIFDIFGTEIAKESIIGEKLSNDILEIMKKDKYKKEELELKIREDIKDENT